MAPKHDPAFAPADPIQYVVPERNTGSIYQSGHDMRLFEDQVARRVGDILMVQLVERTNAKKDADVEVDKAASTEVTVPTIFGNIDPSLLGLELNANLRSTNSFDGEGEVNQSNSLQGSITVSVVQIFPNGNLAVRGEKRVTLNQGNEYIRLSGIVRPIDISASNTVRSDQVADATIMYTGEGAIADSNRMGWLTRLFNSPFFPF